MRIKTRDGTGHLDELGAADRAAVRRQYRALRVAFYAPQSSPYATDGMLQMEYGLSRAEAKQKLFDFYVDVDWHIYFGSK